MLASRGDHITKLAFLAVIAVGVASISSCSRPGADSTTPDGAPQSAAPTRLPSFGDDVIAQMMVSADAAGPQWAPAGSATLGPGTQLTTQGVGQCTANYVFFDNVANVYLGQSAHCAMTAEVMSMNGCRWGNSRSLGTLVSLERGGAPVLDGATPAVGRLVYSSWLSMQQAGETDRNVCAYNDFALVKIAPGQVAAVNPSVPFWGGPVGITSSGVGAGDRVYTYGETNARTDPTGPIVNNIGDLAHELDYARAHSGIPGLRLVLGTESFRPTP
ncbi:hypothetical protein ACQP06_16680 [Nocardia sp. CA-136227]|uniref:hypothetical protein n=1 Tax=Nocardia sp. CA-136227 TaxID=3239979 RepID=UPI003D995AA9